MNWRGLFNPLVAWWYLREIKWHLGKFRLEASLRPKGIGDDLTTLTRDLAELCKLGPQSWYVSAYESLYHKLSVLNEILDVWVTTDGANEDLTERLHDAISAAEDELIHLLDAVRPRADSRLVEA